VVEELGSATGRGVRVAVVDSGWDRSLAVPDLRLLPGLRFHWDPAGAVLEVSDDWGDRSGHGTGCAATVFRVAPDAEICPVRVFGATLETSVPALREGILWAAREGFDVINLSLWTPRPDALVPLYTACEEARAAGSVVVAAAPRDADRAYPSVFDNVLSVGVGPYGSPFEYEYHAGAAVECLAACGDHGTVTWLRGEPIRTAGSSFAAPNVAGIVALLRERHPAAGLDEVRTLLRRYALERAR
jgi:subtilisin family serine protease